MIEEVNKKMSFIQGEYLDSAAVPPQGVEVTIAKIKKEKITNPVGVESEKFVLYFEEIKEYGLVLGAKINRKMLMAKLGSDSSKWAGKKIIIYCDPNVRFGRKVVGGIRIK